jgi:transcriptional regulator with XRE-family HTH domain
VIFWKVIEGKMAYSTINERLKAVRTALNLSQKDFCKSIYLSQSFYAQLEGRIRNINERIIELVTIKYGIRKDWLLTGRGEMFNDPPPNIELNQLLDIYQELDPPFKEYVLLQIKQLLEAQNKSKEQAQQKTPKKRTVTKSRPA